MGGEPLLRELCPPAGETFGGWYVRIDHGRRCCKGIAHRTAEEAWSCWRAGEDRRCEVCGKPTGEHWKRLCGACWRADWRSGAGTAMKDRDVALAGRERARRLQPPGSLSVPVTARRVGAPLSAAELEAAERVRRALGEPPPW